MIAVKVLLLAVLAASATALAVEHPGCVGKDNKACDMLGMLINLKGKGCFRVMKVVPIGQDEYKIICELASYDKSLITYTLKWVDGRKNYVIY